MCIVSFYIKNARNITITIHNQHSGLKLTYPIYFSNGTVCYVSPSQQINTGTTMEASFGIDSKQKNIKGALLYKLQRKYATRTDNHPNSSTASIENTTTSVYLFAIWNVKNYNNVFRACLIECDDDLTWDEDKLRALYKEYKFPLDLQYKSSIITWSINDGTVMKMKLDITYGSNYNLDIIVSEGTRKYYMKKPIEINPKRLVLSYSVLIVLIYALSLPDLPLFKLNIHNQCLNFDLVTPTYITGDRLECYRTPDYKVYAGDTTGSGFIIKSEAVLYGILIYRLRRRHSHESTDISEDTSSATHLLVYWVISNLSKLYADVLLVEHDKRFDWNKDDLEKLYHKNVDQFKLCPDSAKETWSLEDNIALATTFEIMNGSRILNITISEIERDNGTWTPVHINLER
jgi:hypothetical protein